MNRVGHAFIKQRMRDEGAVFGGEVSAHYYFRDFTQADSGVIPFLLMLELVSTRGQKLSEILAPFRSRYFLTGEINTRVADVALKLQELKERFGPEGRVSHLDGLSIDADDWHMNVRPSNTEPLLRLNLEARSQELMEAKRDEVLAVIQVVSGPEGLIELGHVTDRKPPFRYAAYTRVAFSDTDAQGVVYYGRYLPYFDLARTEYHRHLGAIENRGRVRDARLARRVPRAGALRRPARGLRPRRADRHDERHLRPRRLPLRRGRRGRPADGDREADARADRPRRRGARCRCPDAFRARVADFDGVSTARSTPSTGSSTAAATPTTSCARSSTRSSTDGGCAWAGILFAENGELVLGPEAGEQRPRRADPACRSSTTASASPSSSPTAATTARSSSASRR